MGPPHPDDVVIDHPTEINFDFVLTIERKVVTNRHAPSRPKREVLISTVVLIFQSRATVRGRAVARPYRRVTHCEATNPVCGRQVAVEQRRRSREHIPVRIETLLVHVIDRKEEPAIINVKSKQTLDGVAVLGRS